MYFISIWEYENKKEIGQNRGQMNLNNVLTFMKGSGGECYLLEFGHRQEACTRELRLFFFLM